MASTVTLDKSGWSPEALQRDRDAQGAREAHRRYRDALAAHPLAGALDNVSEASLEATRRGSFRFTSRDYGNGHAEASFAFQASDPERVLEAAIKRDCRGLAPRGEGQDREGNIERACRRACSEVHKLCKTMLVDSLWTLTVRANVTDRELMLKWLDAFRRRVVALLGEWKYIAVLERQERGAWHVHLATYALPVHLYPGGVKVKSWEVMRRIWRSVTGDAGGNFDESKRSHWWRPGAKYARSTKSIASYIAGYVSKDMRESELNRKRYSASKGVEIPAAYKAQFPADESVCDLIALAYAAVGNTITSAWWDKARRIFWVESFDPAPA